MFTRETIDNHRTIEQKLREYDGTRVTLTFGSADGFEEHLQRTNGDPSQEAVRLAS